MRPQVRKLVGALSALFVLGASSAWACTCPPEQSAAAQAEDADLVLVGTVITTKHYGRSPYGGPEGYRTQIEVSQSLKGESEGVVVIHSTPPGNPTCGRTFAIGAEILLMAREWNGRHWAGMCSIPQFPLSDFENAFATAE